MRSSAAVVVGARQDRTVVETMRSDPPLLLRPTADALHLVGGAAGPLGGDDQELTVEVGADATLVIRSVAASMAMPGKGASKSRVEARVREGGSLDWAPEPLISVVGSDHTQRTRIILEPGAHLRWRETLVLGRTGEGPGRLTASIRVERAGKALTHHEIRIGDDGWDGPAVLGEARVMISELIVGEAAPPAFQTSSEKGRGAGLPICEDAILYMAISVDWPTAVDTLEKTKEAVVEATR